MNLSESSTVRRRGEDAKGLARKTRLKRTEAFRAVYRRGRWAHRGTLSIGVIVNGQRSIRVGLRTRRGLKGAVRRNRLKRQVRALIFSQRLSLRSGIDVVIVIRPQKYPTKAAYLESDLVHLCKRIGVLSQAKS